MWYQHWSITSNLQAHSGSIKITWKQNAQKSSQIRCTGFPRFSFCLQTNFLTCTVNVLSWVGPSTVQSMQLLQTLLLIDLGTVLGAAMVLEDPHSRNTFHAPRHCSCHEKWESFTDVARDLEGVLSVLTTSASMLCSIIIRNMRDSIHHCEIHMDKLSQQKKYWPSMLG
jgi:hypothetical protein